MTFGAGNSYRAGWRRAALATGATGLCLAALIGWLSWGTTAAIAGAALAGILIARPPIPATASKRDARALLYTLDRNLEHVAEETERAILLTRNATKEISRCFRQWEASVGDDASDLSQTARETSCEIVRLLQFEDISSQALGIGLEGIAECRAALQSLASGKTDIAETRRRLVDWQECRRKDAQGDMKAGSVYLF